MNIKIDSVDDLSLKKTLNMVNVAMHIKSFFNENYNHYYH